ACLAGCGRCLGFALGAPITALAFFRLTLFGGLAALAARLAFATGLAGLARLAGFRLFRLDGAGVGAHQVAIGDLLLGHALDALEQLLLVRGDQRDRLAAASGTAGTADAVHIVFLDVRSEEHTSELQSRENLVCRLLLEKKKNNRESRQTL